MLKNYAGIGVPNNSSSSKQGEQSSSSQNYEALKQELETLKEDFNRFKNHQHLGVDESALFSDNTKFRGRELNLSGAGNVLSGFVSIPLNIKDGSDQLQGKRRVASMGLALLGEKDKTTESIQSFLVSGKDSSLEDVVASDKTDWSVINQAALSLQQYPQATGSFSAPSLTFPDAYLYGYRTPAPTGAGTITLSGNTLTDSNAQFETNALVGGVLEISDATGVLEGHRIKSNTSTVITIDDFPYTGAGVWTSASGSYVYQAFIPVYLGRQEVPFARVHLLDAIVMGVGAVSQLRTIKWGTGSPEGVVTANIGSMYLRFDGGAGTSFYVKESGTGSTGWVNK